MHLWLAGTVPGTSHFLTTAYAVGNSIILSVDEDREVKQLAQDPTARMRHNPDWTQAVRL